MVTNRHMHSVAGNELGLVTKCIQTRITPLMGILLGKTATTKLKTLSILEQIQTYTQPKEDLPGKNRIS